MKNKSEERSKSLRILTQKLNSNHELLEQLKLIHKEGKLTVECFKEIKKNNFKKKYLEIILTKALRELVILKNSNLILEEIKADTAKYLNIKKIIKNTKNKQQPKKSYTKSWHLFSEFRATNSKNPTLKEFTNLIQNNSIFIEDETIRKYWREFKEKIDSGLYLLEIAKK